MNALIWLYQSLNAINAILFCAQISAPHKGTWAQQYMDIWNSYTWWACVHMLIPPPHTHTQACMHTHAHIHKLFLVQLALWTFAHLKPKWQSKGKMNPMTLCCNGAETNSLIGQHKPCPGISYEIYMFVFFGVFLLKAPAVFMWNRHMN